MDRNRLKELVAEAGLSISDFADKAGITRQSASHYLNGDRMPDVITLKRICSVMNVSADWLLGLSDVRKPDADMKAVVEYTGLVEKVVDELHPTAQYQYGSSKLDSKLISAILLAQEWKNVQQELSEFLYHLRERTSLFKELLEKPQEDIEINDKLDQNEDNIDLRIFKASRSFSLLLDKMADAFLEIPVNKLNGTEVEDFKTYLAEHYRSLYMTAKDHIKG